MMQKLVKLNSALFALFVLFAVLKLTETVDWSWFYVTLPIFLPLYVILSAGLLFMVFALLVLLGLWISGKVESEEVHQRRAKTALVWMKKIEVIFGRL
ncbi:hypothetical protein PHYNN_97 [Pantoea phage Phynn]|nr:hypothetical protein PHYNN_97 [Pantoea phage Phynn]